MQWPIRLKFTHSVGQVSKDANKGVKYQTEIIFFLPDVHVSLKWQEKAPQKHLNFLVRADNPLLQVRSVAEASQGSSPLFIMAKIQIFMQQELKDCI